MFNRKIKHFHGDSIVIGCGDQLVNKAHDLVDGCHHYLHGNENYFYSIDYNSSVNPDAVLDIRSHLPEGMQQRFNFVFLEFLSEQAYASPDHYFNNEEILKLLDIKHGAALFILGNRAKFSDDRLTHRETSKRNKVNDNLLVVYVPKKVSVALFLKSLNQDAQKLIHEFGFCLNIENELHYNVKMNESFIKIKSLQIIQRQIDRLSEELDHLIVINADRKKEKIMALNQIKVAITNDYPAKTMRSIINEINAIYQGLCEGWFNHQVEEHMQMIFEMETYHAFQIQMKQATYLSQSSLFADKKIVDREATFADSVPVPHFIRKN